MTDRLGALAFNLNVDQASRRMGAEKARMGSASRENIDSAAPVAEVASAGTVCGAGLDGADSEGGSCGMSADGGTLPIEANPEDQAIAQGLLHGQSPGKPTLIEFYSQNCPICMQMVPTMAMLEQDCRRNDIHIVKLDITNDSNRRLAHSYGVPGVPTFVFVDPDGAEVARLIGAQKPADLQRALKVASGEECKDYNRLPKAN